MLTSPPRLAFRNPKTLKDRLVRSKFKESNEKSGVNLCNGTKCDVCNILHQGTTFESTHTNKQCKINFNFNCNSKNVIYLLTCRICQKQYVGSTTTKFRSRFNQNKSNFNLYGKGRRGFVQESFLENVFDSDYNGTHKDMKVQIIDYCDPIGIQNKRKTFGYTIWTQ